MSAVPSIRIAAANDRPHRSDFDYVLYWMISSRRAGWNFGLQRALEWAARLRKPLIVFEALRIGYRWASDRIHRFVLDGMANNARLFARPDVLYFPYVEPAAEAGKGLLTALAERACMIVTDEFPCFFLLRMVAAAAAKIPVLLEKVDSNGLLPLRATDRIFTTAFSFRAYLQKNLSPHLLELPKPDPFAGAQLPKIHNLPDWIARRRPPASRALLGGNTGELSRISIDHAVPVAPFVGGPAAGQAALKEFFDRRLPMYLSHGNDPDEETRSGLSPYLHFGHVSAHQVFCELMARENWSASQINTKAGGRRGWWGVGAPAEAFLDQLVTWRELGYNMAAKRDDYDRFESLPDWALATLRKHAADPRPHLYSLEQLGRAATHDRLWNAAQNQLVVEGRIHNYLRMLWGKKILEWTATPEAALAVMIEMNNKYALDGRDPNSYSGIFWTLGRYDHPWGPERPIFGSVRYMSSDNTVRKVAAGLYLDRYAPQPGVPPTQKTATSKYI